MTDTNRVILTGRLTRDPELKSTAKGQEQSQSEPQGDQAAAAVFSALDEDILTKDDAVCRNEFMSYLR